MDPGAHPITGVSTTIAAFVGFAQAGPLTPISIDSFADYGANFGGFALGEYLAHAVQGFFHNGGARCYILRLPPELQCGSGQPNPTIAGLLSPLDSLDDVSIVCCPDEYSVAGMAAELVAHCERLRYRIAVLGAPPNGPLTGGPPEAVESSFAAYDAPWVLVADAEGGAAFAVHPGGHVAGTMVRSDLQ